MNDRPLRLVYYTTWAQGDADGPGDGVRKKIGGQMRSLIAAGVDARLFIVAAAPCAGAWSKELPPERFQIFLHRSRGERERAAARLGAAIRDVRADVVYSRQEPLYVGLLPTLARVPLVIELNGNEREETRGAPLYYRAYRRVSREVTARVARGVVAVSNEFLSLEPYRGRGLPYVVIANGIDLGGIEPLDPLDPPARRPEPRFVFIGGVLGAAWHGIPKIIELARHRPDWHFDLIGLTQTDLAVEPLPNLITHGVLRRDQYRPILAAADVGLGSLSAHLKGNHEGSALKTRDYLAHGLPAIIGYRDTDFLAGAPFLLELPNNASNVMSSVARIEAFAKAWKGRRVERADILHLDNAQKEERRLEFLRRVANAAGRGSVS